jgi:hypothetical protein
MQIIPVVFVSIWQFTSNFLFILILDECRLADFLPLSLPFCGEKQAYQS